MKFLANENIPYQTFLKLKSGGWDIDHISGSNAGITDVEVISHSLKESRIIITFDSDYGNLVYRNGYKPLGVIYLRFKSYTTDSLIAILQELVTNDDLALENKFTVVDQNQIRQRDI